MEGLGIELHKYMYFAWLVSAITPIITAKSRLFLYV